MKAHFSIQTGTVTFLLWLAGMTAAVGMFSFQTPVAAASQHFDSYQSRDDDSHDRDDSHDSDGDSDRNSDRDSDGD